MTAFCIVEAEDWAGLYVDGALVEEGHQISLETLIDHLRTAGVNIQQLAMSKESDEAMCESGASMPTSLADAELQRRK